jgi:adenine-specific DNA methylase
MPTGKCPHCEAEIERLNFESDVTQWGHEWGTADLDGDNMDYDDSEYTDGETGEVRYLCPVCEHELSPSDVIYDDNVPTHEENEIELEMNEDGEVIHPLPEEAQPIVLQGGNSSVTIKSMTCFHCGNKRNPIEDNEESVLCTKCGISLTKDNSEIIEFGFKRT